MNSDNFPVNPQKSQTQIPQVISLHMKFYIKFMQEEDSSFDYGIYFKEQIPAL